MLAVFSVFLEVTGFFSVGLLRIP